MDARSGAHGFKAIALEMALGDGRPPAWRMGMVQPSWDLERFKRHAVTLLCGPQEHVDTVQVFLVRCRLERVESLSQIRAGDKILLTLDGGPPVPYATLGCGSTMREQALGAMAGSAQNFAPAVIPALSYIRVVQVACAANHMCVVTKDGLLLSFGSSASGRLGHGPPTAEEPRLPDAGEGDAPAPVTPAQAALAPVDLAPSVRAQQVACGAAFTMVVTRNAAGVAQLWAFGEAGPWLGLGLAAGSAAEDVWLPRAVQLPGQDGAVEQVVCGARHCLAWTATGQLFSWGENKAGKLGHVCTTAYEGAGRDSGDIGCSDEPLFRRIDDMDDVFAGQREAHVGVSLAPEQVQRLEARAAIVETGRRHEAASGMRAPRPSGEAGREGQQRGAVWAYAGPFKRVFPLAREAMGSLQEAGSGELVSHQNDATRQCSTVFVLPTQDAESKPRCVVMLRGFRIRSAAAGANHSLMADDTGRLFACGQNDQGQLGLGSEIIAGTGSSGMPVPCQVTTSAGLAACGVSKVSCGDAHSVALGRDGKVYTWGASAIGRDGDPHVPGEVFFEGAPLGSVEDVSAGARHTVCCTAFGHAFGFGSNASGQLGLSPDAFPSVPSPIMLETAASAVLGSSSSSQPSAAATPNYSGNSPSAPPTAESFRMLQPENDPSLFICAVAAGGGGQHLPGNTLLLSASQVSSRLMQQLSHLGKGAATARRKDYRNICVGWSLPPHGGAARDAASQCVVM